MLEILLVRSFVWLRSSQSGGSCNCLRDAKAISELLLSAACSVSMGHTGLWNSSYRWFLIKSFGFRGTWCTLLFLCQNSVAWMDILSAEKDFLHRNKINFTEECILEQILIRFEQRKINFVLNKTLFECLLTSMSCTYIAWPRNIPALCPLKVWPSRLRHN